MINKHKSNKIKENSNTVRHWNNGTDHRHSKSCCDKSSPARRTIRHPRQLCMSIHHNHYNVFNTLRLRGDVHHFAVCIFKTYGHFSVGIFKPILFYENCCIFIQILLKFVLKCPIYNEPSLVHVMAWCQTGNRSLSDPLNEMQISWFWWEFPHWLLWKLMNQFPDVCLCVRDSMF